MANLKNKTILVTGASRGIGRAIALRCAKDGANLVLAGKTVEPHPKLKGTLYTVAEEVQAVGGNSLVIQTDVRHEEQVLAMVQQAAKTFGGIDALVNNAGAISLTSVERTETKRFDLMLGINARAVYLCSRLVLPYLKQSSNGHIINLSPPLNVDVKWLKDFSPYTLSKYGMTLLTMGMAAEFASYKIAVNSLWPRTMIATAAIEMILGGEQAFKRARKPEIMADAAYEILVTEGCALTGQALIDDTFLRERGVKDFSQYAWDATVKDNELMPDLFV